MPETLNGAERPAQEQSAAYDAIVIGAGVSGLYQL